MTPGVIPSKRHEFSANIGTMVGEHLLTGEELNKALLKKPFQSHLYEVIRTRLSLVTKLDLGSINNIIPKRYRNYLDIALQTAIYRLKGLVREKIVSEIGEHARDQLIERWLDDVLRRDISELVSVNENERILSRLESSISEMLQESELTVVVEEDDKGL